MILESGFRYTAGGGLSDHGAASRAYRHALHPASADSRLRGLRPGIALGAIRAGHGGRRPSIRDVPVRLAGLVRHAAAGRRMEDAAW